ncbi:MAG: cell division protein FtsQ/DivIB [Terriglobales bacterium]
MARKSGPTISQEELYPLADEPGREEVHDARLLDLDVEQEPPFLRVQKRVPVRRGSLPKKTVTRLTWAAVALVVIFLCGITVASLYHYGERSWRFRVESSDDIEISGLQNVARSQVMEVMGGDIGRNIFFVPLAQRKAQLEQIPWVESASVMRFIPNRLKVEIHERTPVAFARVGSRILLSDDVGTLMELPGKKKYSFPVIVGMNQGEPPSTRAARMKIYNDVVRQLDSGGARYSQDLSEIDLSDPDDVKVLANNRAGEVLVHLGSSNYLERYKIYVTHVQEWRQQFDKLESVDLRYDRQIIVNPDSQGAAKQPQISAGAAKKAMAAGVKPAALITRMTTGPKPSPTLTAKTVPPLVLKPSPARPAASKPAAARKMVKAGHRKAHVRQTRLKTKTRPRTTASAAPKSGQKTSASGSAGNANPQAAAKAPAKPSPAIAKGEETQ